MRAHNLGMMTLNCERATAMKLDIYAKPATENCEVKFIASKNDPINAEKLINELRQQGYDGEIRRGKYKIGEFFNNEEFDITDFDI